MKKRGQRTSSKSLDHDERDVGVGSMLEDAAWSRDALERRPLADFLTRSLVRLSQDGFDGERGGITVALDADWGAGKTFFVREWIKDLRSAGHPIVYFDAWSNDLGEEASVALMAEILEGLKPWKDQLPKDQATRKAVKELSEDSIRSLRAAILPAVGVIAKGLVKKATGVAIDEVMEVVRDGEKSGDLDLGFESTVGDALDKLFEKAIDSHTLRKRAISSFKQSLAEMIDLLEKNTKANLPLFVFIDELDRCRPSYALGLLEEVKHIFGIPGVVYVISTNIDQLQNSVRAVYGVGFDGRGYLRRMFDKEYSLPSPSSDSFIKLVEEKLAAIVQGSDLTGLPDPSQNKNMDPWTLIAKAMMPRDLRSQKQAISLISEVYSSISGPVHLLWLYYLAALFRTRREALDHIVAGKVEEKNFREFVMGTIEQDQEISFTSWSNHWGEDKRAGVAKLSDVIVQYLSLCIMSKKQLDSLADYEGYAYPRALAMDVLQSSRNGKRSISSYASLVRSAGYLIVS